MSKRIIISVAILGFMCTGLRGQGVKREKMERTDSKTNHMYVDLDLPAGEVKIKSSGSCGVSVTKLQAPDSSLIPNMTTTQQESEDGKLHGIKNRKVQLQTKYTTNAHSWSGAGANLRTTDQLVNINSYTSEEEIITEYQHDPNLSTDLNLQLGVGRADLDLSGMTLENFSVRSAFADVFVTYQLPNQARMKKMDIHATRANVKLTNLEKANVELVSVQNDMGETHVSLGKGNKSKSTIYLQSGVGNCTLEISENQPVMIVLKRGLFSKLNNQGNFEKLQNEKMEVYVNRAYHSNPEQVTKVICSLDLGDITLIKN
ncbi:MAG: hypothetical protein MRZ79_22135 [Bacteroidia bacterium]|nr:hypothetical protein [Bacteroidia bacterium]